SGIERELRRVAAVSHLLLPDRARDVDQGAAAVPFAVHVAGAMKHLLKRDEAVLDQLVRRPAVTADRGVEGAGILVLDGRGRPPRLVGLDRGITSDRMLSGHVTLAGHGAALRRVGAQISSRVPRLLRAGARRVYEGRRIIVRTSRMIR